MTLDAAYRIAYRAAFRFQLLYWRLRRPVLTGAYVALWHDGRLLCVQNSYRRRLSLPAGGLSRGESPVEAARRELEEEVGVAASTAELVYFGEIVSRAGHAEDHAHFFELRPEHDPEVRVDGREVVWAGFLAPEEALRRGVVDVVRQYLERTLAARP